MIIVAVDYLTKWVELKAMPTGKADDVAEFFVNQIALYNTLLIDLELDADPNPLLTEEDAAMIYADRLQADLTEAKEITSIQDNTERAAEKDQQNNGERQEEAQDLPDSVHSQPQPEEEVTVPEEINVSPDTAGNEVTSYPPDQISSNASRRPIRNRRPPASYLTFLVPFFIFLLAPSTSSSLILREKAIFKKQADVIFSESPWTIVTDLDFGLPDTATAYLKEKILQQQEVAERWKNQGSRPQEIAAKRITSRMQFFLKVMENAADRLSNIKKALNTNQRNRRSLVDGGGLILKWLFEVSTQKDLEEFSNHSTSLPKSTRKLRGQYSMLKKVTTIIMEKIADMENVELSHFEYFLQLEETFEAMNQILLWVQQLADSLEVSLNFLANGHLDP
ncbi:hypothetical protein OUZ56_005738 [Daphnia magna]|uniref:Uncharacterized protein n=1 Tax=Daphnia magna TaxID=35525 RepID=A0ABQ9YTN8_9CRUS|nr:hypothetical protein OUZ56_005738 [Daphnia magna]